MKYYSEILDELFDTEKELFKQEEDFRIKEEKRKTEAAEKKRIKEELQKEIQESYDYFLSLIKEYNETYKEPIKITIPKSDFKSVFDDLKTFTDLFFM